MSFVRKGFVVFLLVGLLRFLMFEPQMSTTSVPKTTTEDKASACEWPPLVSNKTYVMKIPPDRSGTCVLHFIQALAYCKHHGYKFVGVCRAPSNGIRESEMLVRKMGLYHLFPYLRCPETNMSHVMLQSQDYVPFRLTDAFRKYIISESIFANYTKNNKKPGELNAVMHVRRGDVFPCGTPNVRMRYLPNQHYLQILERYAPDATNITVHTKVTDGSSRRGAEKVTPDFASFNIVDGGDLWTAWKDMITADVLIMSKSGFSYTPSIFNQNLVLYTPMWRPKLPNWVEVDEDIVNASLQRVEIIQKEGCG